MRSPGSVEQSDLFVCSAPCVNILGCNMDNPSSRKTLRLNAFDYSYNNAFFVTICTYNKRSILSRIRRSDPCVRPTVELSEVGLIAEKVLHKIEQTYDILLDEYVIMPNHIHMIIIISPESGSEKITVSLGNVIGAYKSIVVNEFRKLCNDKHLIMGKIWQRNYYEYIIRNHKDLKEIRDYIYNNPIRWYFRENTSSSL